MKAQPQLKGSQESAQKACDTTPGVGAELKVQHRDSSASWRVLLTVWASLLSQLIDRDSVVSWKLGSNSGQLGRIQCNPVPG